MRRALQSCSGRASVVRILVVDMVCLWRRCPFLSALRLVASVVFERIFNASNRRLHARGRFFFFKKKKLFHFPS